MNLISFLFYFIFFERHQESGKKLSISMRVRAFLLRIFNKILFGPLEYKCRVHLVLVGRGKWKVRDEAVKLWNKAEKPVNGKWTRHVRTPQRHGKQDGWEAPQRAKQQLSLRLCIKRPCCLCTCWTWQQTRARTAVASGALMWFLFSSKNPQLMSSYFLALSEHSERGE